jgi:hypothetical protein
MVKIIFWLVRSTPHILWITLFADYVQQFPRNPADFGHENTAKAPRPASASAVGTWLEAWAKRRHFPVSTISRG